MIIVYLIKHLYAADPGMAMDLELSVTGSEPGKVSETIYCYVMNLDDPLHLHVEAEFKVIYQLFLWTSQVTIKFKEALSKDMFLWLKVSSYMFYSIQSLIYMNKSLFALSKIKNIVLKFNYLCLNNLVV